MLIVLEKRSFLANLSQRPGLPGAPSELAPAEKLASKQCGVVSTLSSRSHARVFRPEYPHECFFPEQFSRAVYVSASLEGFVVEAYSFAGKANRLWHEHVTIRHNSGAERRVDR